MRLDNYDTLVFDCDGVVLNSNKVKTQAFYNAALSYGHNVAKALVVHHVKNGGISRYKKFEHFLENIIGVNLKKEKLDSLLNSFSEEVIKGLMSCEIAEGLHALRKKTSHTKWLIISGGDQSELRDVFKKRKLAHLFGGGIYGSPESKEQILAREISRKNIQLPALYFGDSKYDYKAAKNAGLNFIFVREWSEWTDWADYLIDNKSIVTENIKSFYRYIKENNGKLS